MSLGVPLYFYVPSNHFTYLQVGPGHISVPPAKRWHLISATNPGWCCLQKERWLPVCLAIVTSQMQMFTLSNYTLGQAETDHSLGITYSGHHLTPQTPEFKGPSLL